MRNRVILIFFLITLSLSQLYSQSLGFRTRVSGYYLGGQFSYDIYKPYSQIFINLKRFSSPVVINKGEEFQIYSMLFERMLSPKYVLFQTTFYQMTALSSFLETDHSIIYHRFNSISDINLLRSFGSGYEEPYAFTLFVGNILFLSYGEKTNQLQSKKPQAGSALAGVGYSFGKHQVLDNIYLHDFWQQLELILVGNLHEPERRKMSWNFRIGLKFHNNGLLRDVYVLTFERNHTSWTANNLSITQNSVFKYQSYVPQSFSNRPPFFVYHLLTYGKKFPVEIFKRKIFLLFGGGFKWEWVHLYDRNLNKFNEKPSGHITWLIQPNIEF